MKYATVNSSTVSPLRRSPIVYRHRETSRLARYVPVVVALLFVAALVVGFAI